MKFVVFLCLIASTKAYAGFFEDTIPYSFVGGQVDGMKVIQDLPQSSGLAKLGVKKDDIVIDVDGNPIINQQASKEAYDTKSPKTIVVLRNGRKVSLR